MVDKYIVQTQNPSMLLWWSLLLLGVMVVEGFLQLISSYFSNLLAQSVIRDLRKKIIEHCLRLRMSYFDKNPVGAMVTRVVSDMEAITEVFSSGIMEIISDLFSLVFILSLMFLNNWELAWMTLVPIPFLLLATKIFAKSMKDSFQKERVAVTRLNTFVQERLSGMSVVQLFNREREEFKRFEKINEGHKQAHIIAAKTALMLYGAIYVPADVMFPYERIQMMKEECNSQVLINCTTDDAINELFDCVIQAPSITCIKQQGKIDFECKIGKSVTVIQIPQNEN
jgi:ABC-type multidrug transport system fused ATPase/permease subunit